MANIFEAVREAVPVPVAAKRCGLKANHAGYFTPRKMVEISGIEPLTS